MIEYSLIFDFLLVLANIWRLIALWIGVYRIKKKWLPVFIYLKLHLRLLDGSNWIKFKIVLIIISVSRIIWTLLKQILCCKNRKKYMNILNGHLFVFRRNVFVSISAYLTCYLKICINLSIKIKNNQCWNVF